MYQKSIENSENSGIRDRFLVPKHKLGSIVRFDYQYVYIYILITFAANNYNGTPNRHRRDAQQAPNRHRTCSSITSSITKNDGTIEHIEYVVRSSLDAVNYSVSTRVLSGPYIIAAAPQLCRHNFPDAPCAPNALYVDVQPSFLGCIIVSESGGRR
jgi:hypothetical protein